MSQGEMRRGAAIPDVWLQIDVPEVVQSPDAEVGLASNTGSAAVGADMPTPLCEGATGVVGSAIDTSLLEAGRRLDTTADRKRLSTKISWAAAELWHRDGTPPAPAQIVRYLKSQRKRSKGAGAVRKELAERYPEILADAEEKLLIIRGMQAALDMQSRERNVAPVDAASRSAQPLPKSPSVVGRRSSINQSVGSSLTSAELTRLRALYGPIPGVDKGAVPVNLPPVTLSLPEDAGARYQELWQRYSFEELTSSLWGISAVEAAEIIAQHTPGSPPKVIMQVDQGGERLQVGASRVVTPTSRERGLLNVLWLERGAAVPAAELCHYLHIDPSAFEMTFRALRRSMYALQPTASGSPSLASALKMTNPTQGDLQVWLDPRFLLVRAPVPNES